MNQHSSGCWLPTNPCAYVHPGNRQDALGYPRGNKRRKHFSTVVSWHKANFNIGDPHVVPSSHYRFGGAEAVMKAIRENRVTEGNTKEAKLAKLANHLATGGLQAAKTKRRRVRSCASGTLTELMSTVHTATSAAAQGRRINAKSSRHDCSDLTSGIFTGAFIHWNGAGGERAHSISIRLQVRRVLQCCQQQRATNALNGRP